MADETAPITGEIDSIVQASADIADAAQEVNDAADDAAKDKTADKTADLFEELVKLLEKVAGLEAALTALGEKVERLPQPIDHSESLKAIQEQLAATAQKAADAVSIAAGSTEPVKQAENGAGQPGDPYGEFVKQHAK